MDVMQIKNFLNRAERLKRKLTAEELTMFQYELDKQETVIRQLKENYTSNNQLNLAKIADAELTEITNLKNIILSKMQK